MHNSIYQPTEPIIIRVSSPIWIQVILPLIVLLGFGIYFIATGASWICLSATFFWGAVIFFAVWRTKFKLTPDYFSVYRGIRKSPDFYWTDILSAEHIQQGQENLLKVGTSSGFYEFNLKDFDAAKVWQQFQMYVSAETLEPEAYKRVPAYQEWLKEKHHLLHSVYEPFQTCYSFGTRAVLLVVFLFFTSLSVLFFATIDGLTNNVGALLLSGVSILVSGLAFVSSVVVKVEMTSETIVVKSLGCSGTIRWEDVQSIEDSVRKRKLIFEGSEKKVAIIRPQMWSGKDRQDMLNMLLVQVEHRDIHCK